MRNIIKITSIMVCILLFTTLFPVTTAIETKYSNTKIRDESKTYFVIGICMVHYGSHFGDYSYIAPIFLLRFGKPFGRHILGFFNEEEINLHEDVFIGYPALLSTWEYNTGIGFVCGIWIDN